MSKSTPFQTGSLESDARLVYVVDDDELVRGALSGLLRSIDIDVRAFASTEEFLAADKPAIPDSANNAAASAPRRWVASPTAARRYAPPDALRPVPPQR